MKDEPGTDDYLAPPKPKKVMFPPKRTYVVKRVVPANSFRIEEIIVEAHRFINEPDQNAVAFFDFVDTPEGPIIETHRLFFDVLEVEMVMRELNRRNSVVQ